MREERFKNRHIWIYLKILSEKRDAHILRESNIARTSLKLTHDELEKCSFTCAVLRNESNLLSLFDGKINILKQGFPGE